MFTYNVGIFITDESPKRLQNLVEKYKYSYGGNRLGYKRGLTRAEVVKLIKNNKTEELVIYCPARDSYIDKNSLEDFKFTDLKSNFARLYYDEGARLCGRINDVLYFGGGLNIGVDIITDKIVPIKWVPDELGGTKAALV